MGAWFVLSALGIYQLAGSSPNWVLGSPLFARTVISLEGGSELVILAHDNDKVNSVVESIAGACLQSDLPTRAARRRHVRISRYG